MIKGRKILLTTLRSLLRSKAFALVKFCLIIAVVNLSLVVAGCAHNELFFEGCGENWSANVHVLEQRQGHQLIIMATYNGDRSKLENLKFLSIGFEWLNQDATYETNSASKETINFHGDNSEPINAYISQAETIEHGNGSTSDNEFQKSFLIGEHFDITAAADVIRITIEWDNKQDKFYVVKQEN